MHVVNMLMHAQAIAYAYIASSQLETHPKVHVMACMCMYMCVATLMMLVHAYIIHVQLLFNDIDMQLAYNSDLCNNFITWHLTSV